MLQQATKPPSSWLCYYSGCWLGWLVELGHPHAPPLPTNWYRRMFFWEACAQPPCRGKQVNFTPNKPQHCTCDEPPPTAIKKIDVKTQHRLFVHLGTPNLTFFNLFLLKIMTAPFSILFLEIYF